MTSRHRSDQSPLRGPMPQYANAACGLSTPEVPSRSLPPISGYDIHAISFSRPSVGHPRASGVRSPGQRNSFSRGSGRHCLSSFKRRLRRQFRMETETRRALELKSAVRQGAGLLPPMLCRSEGRKRNGSRCEHSKIIRLEKNARGSVQHNVRTALRHRRRKVMNNSAKQDESLAALGVRAIKTKSRGNHETQKAAGSRAACL